MNDTSSVTLESVEFIGLRSPLEPPATFSWGVADERNVGLVRVRTSDGVEGWGETSVTFPLWSMEERAVTVRKGLAPLVTGRRCGNLDEIRDLVADAERSMARLRLLWAPVGISGAIAALEMALIDAWARAQGAPAWQLLGGEATPQPMYAVGFTGEARTSATAAASALGDGYAAVKVRLGFGAEQDLALLATYREVLGDDATILTDVNMGWDLKTTVEMLPALADFGLGWLEEPLPRGEVDALRMVKQAASMPLAAGENCFTRAESLALIESGAVDVFMPDLARCGGLLMGIELASRAVELGLGYSPHHYASDIGFSAMVNLCAVVGAPAPILRDVSHWPLRGDLLSEPVQIADGRVVPSTRPGLCPAVDTTVIERFRVL